MKHIFRETVIGAATALILPCASWAQDSPVPETPPSPAAQETQPTAATGSLESGGTFADQQNKAGPASGGVLVHEGKAYIIHQLQTEMSLPDGSKVQPNGTIESRDGSLRQMGEDQLLSLDGRMLPSPFKDSPQSSALPGSTQTETAPLGIPGTSGPAPDGSTTTPGTSTDLPNPATGTTIPAQPQTTSPDTTAPSSNKPFTPDSGPIVPPAQPNPLESTSPGSGLQDTSPQTLSPETKPSTDSSSTQTFRESNTVPKVPENISTDPTRDRVE